MGSFVAWVDYSQAEQDRMRQAIGLFKDNETRDELGLGMIRDALADLLFPGTSTIQTRLRYFLIVPWIYRNLERRRGVTSTNVEHHVKKVERSLIKPLTATKELGVFGAVSGQAIRRLPSGVYWNGLRQWGILAREPGGAPARWSQEELHDSWDRIRTRNEHSVAADDSGIPRDLVRVWDPRLPDPPSEWPESITLTPTRREAEYLRGRMESCAGSLLAHFARHPPQDLATAAPWDSADNLPPKLERLVTQANAFSIVSRGAGLLYSLELCRRSNLDGHRDRIPSHEENLVAWSVQAERVAAWWKPEDLWSLLADEAMPVPAGRPDRRFVEQWFSLVQARGAAAITNDAAAGRLVEERECRVKGSARSRFHNEQARNRWGGASGTAQMDYRWFRVRGLLKDLYDGLARD